MPKGAAMIESHFRSIIKALSWRFLATLITFSVSWIIIGELKIAAEIGLADTVIKLGVYYTHERLWNRLSFGKMQQPEYQI
jgi:uncharacterized membrane protein